MNGYNAMKLFKTKEEAQKFAEKVNSKSWGWMKDKNGNITNWYVDCMAEDLKKITE